MNFWIYLSYRGMLRALGGFAALIVLVAMPGLLSKLSIGALPHATVFYLLLTLSGCALIFRGLRPKWVDRPLGWTQGIMIFLTLVVLGFSTGELAAKAVVMSDLSLAAGQQMTIVLWCVAMALGTVAGTTGVVVSLFSDVSGSRAVFGQSSSGI
ncbi:hypothetical protein shim_11810 [Shimia sp. SK013]|uniref:hypothetical protein n=1 Tax=Shimia sp. SK013 TaxID=1389006 RepID=UPI0006B618A9|nr:hypothetical protein [Shimia sp. SK013]KPA22891.1 hypothetical protein shim_11810 [Shimia sp. SK013]